MSGECGVTALQVLRHRAAIILRPARTQLTVSLFWKVRLPNAKLQMGQMGNVCDATEHLLNFRSSIQ